MAPLPTPGAAGSPPRTIGVPQRHRLGSTWGRVARRRRPESGSTREPPSPRAERRVRPTRATRLRRSGAPPKPVRRRRRTDAATGTLPVRQWRGLGNIQGKSARRADPPQRSGLRRGPQAVQRYDRQAAAADRALCRCRDVICAVRLGRDHELLTAIRGGGHNGPGVGSCDDGLVSDLSPMKGVRVDPANRTVRVGPGCTQGDVDHATC